MQFAMQNLNTFMRIKKIKNWSNSAYDTLENKDLTNILVRKGRGTCFVIL